MMLLRRSALRALSPSSSFFVPTTRSITTFTSSPRRISTSPSTIQFQRRWATNEAESKNAEAPISKLQPTPQEEVENAIQADNAAQVSADPVAESSSESISESAPVVAETANATEATEEHIPAAEPIPSGQEVQEPTVDSIRSTVGHMGSQVQTPEAKPWQRPADYMKQRAELTRKPKPTIYIGNLFFDVTENDIVKELTRFGTVVRCRIMRDSRGLSKGYGYADFETTEAATEAVQSLNQQLFEGRRLTVQYAAYETKDVEDKKRSVRPNGPVNPPSKTLFIGNMSFEMTDRDLNNLFRGIRNVIDVRVAIDRRTGQPRGFAHADFIDVKSAMEAMKVLAEKETYGRKLRVDYSYGPSTAPRNRPPTDSEN